MADWFVANGNVFENPESDAQRLIEILNRRHPLTQPSDRPYLRLFPPFFHPVVTYTYPWDRGLPKGQSRFCGVFGGKASRKDKPNPIERGDNVRHKRINQEAVVTAGEHDGLVMVNLKGTIAVAHAERRRRPPDLR